jgi:hypothetical protein
MGGESFVRRNRGGSGTVHIDAIEEQVELSIAALPLIQAGYAFYP